MAGTNIDPHDMATLPAGESLTGKRFYLVKINETGEVVLGTAKSHGFVLQNEPAAKGEGADLAVPLQVKAVCHEEIKAGWLLECNSEGKLVKAAEEKHVIGISLMTGKAGAVISFSSFPGGCTG